MSGKPKYVPEDSKNRIFELRKLGLSARKISAEVGIPRERVRQILLRSGFSSSVPISLDLVDYSHVDQHWMAEFRGFFMGEGCATISYYPNAKGRAHYQGQLSIGLRDDDINVILDISHHLGGNVHRFGIRRNGNPGIAWQVVGWTRCTNLSAILVDGLLPSKKRRDLALFSELCQKRLCWPYNLKEKHLAEIHRYYLALQDIKRYKGSEG